MNQIRSPQRQATDKVKHRINQQSTRGSKSNFSRFAEARLLVLALRQIFNCRIWRVLDTIRLSNRPSPSCIKVIDKIVDSRKHQAFTALLMYVRQSTNISMRRKVDRVNPCVFLPYLLAKLYIKHVKRGFNKLSNNCKNSLSLQKMLLCLEHLEEKMKLQAKAMVWRLMRRIQQHKKTKKNAICFMARSLSNCYHNHIKWGFDFMVMASSSNQCQRLYGISQSNRKKYYELENNRRQLIVSERQSLQCLKQMIDSQAQERSIKIGEIKRDSSIQVSQAQQKVRSLQRQLERLGSQFNSFQRKAEKLMSIAARKQKLLLSSHGAVSKVHDIFNSLKYEAEQNKSTRSSSFGNIVLNKEKFRSYLTEFDKSRSDIESYQVYQNIIKRNLVCEYERVPICSIKLSEEYVLAQDENANLKQLINSMLCYHLLKDQGDVLLSVSNTELNNLFSDLFAFTEKQHKQRGQGGELVKVSTTIQSAKSLGRKAPGRRTSTSSLQSIQ